MIAMNTIQEVDLAQAYFEEMLWAAFGVRIFSDNAKEWQNDTVKKYAKKLKNEEIEHSEIAQTEKDHQKWLWEQWIDETTKWFKKVLRIERRMG